MRFYFGWKSHFGVQSALYLCSHELRRNETQNGMDFISVILTEIKFQTGMRFSCEHNLHETKWISADSCHFDRNEVSFLVIKYVNTIRNEMSAHVHQNIGSFWKAAEMKLHVNKTCFHASLKSQTGMSSFRRSCEHTLRTPFLTEYLQWRLLVFFTKSSKHSDALIDVLEKCCSGNFRKTYFSKFKDKIM